MPIINKIGTIYVAPNLADCRSEADTHYKGVDYFNFYRADDGDIVLMRWYKPDGSNLMGRDVCVMAGWNGEESSERDMELFRELLDHVQSGKGAEVTTKGTRLKNANIKQGTRPKKRERGVR